MKASDCNDYYKHKFDEGKTPWDLIPIECFEAINTETHNEYWADIYKTLLSKYKIDIIKSFFGVRKVLEHGAEKYEFDSWKNITNAKQRYFAAYMRHRLNEETEDYFSSEHIDPDSGLLSVYHALTNIIFLLYFEIQEKKT